MSVTLSVYLSRVLMFEQRLAPGVNITDCVIQGWPRGAGSLRLVTLEKKIKKIINQG